MSNWVWTSLISLSEMNMVGLAFRLLQEQSPSGFIITNRYSQAPIICDFLKIRSKATAPSRCQALQSCRGVFLSTACHFTSFDCNFVLTIFRKISSDLSLGPSLSTQVSVNSSSLSKTLILRLNLPSSSAAQRWMRTSLEQEMARLLTQNSFSSSSNSVSIVSFFSSSITVQAGNSCCDGPFTSFPLDRLLSTFLGCFISPISSSLLCSFSSDEEVPNSSRLMRMSSCLRLSFILMYQSCWRLNSASFSSSLSSPTKSSLLLTCLYSISPNPTLSFFPPCPTTSALFTPSLIYPLYYKHTSPIIRATSQPHTFQARPIGPIGQQQIYQDMKREDRQTLSLEALARHQERIHGMVQKIQQYKPTFHRNQTYKGCNLAKLVQQRQKRSDQLFEENMKLIHRIETTGPKIETKRFPQIKNNPRRLKSLSITRSRSSSNGKVKTKDVFRNGEQVFEENMRLITNIECTGPKIQCWTTRKTRNLNQLVRIRKREEEKRIMEKFKDISKELAKIGRARETQYSASIASLRACGLGK